MTSWRVWTRWNDSMAKTLSDAQHAAAGDLSLSEARKAAAKTGEPAILNFDQLADHDMLGRIWVLTGEDLHRCFGSRTPSKKAIESDTVFLEGLEAGQAVAVTAFSTGKPAAVLFAGQPEAKKTKPRAR